MKIIFLIFIFFNFILADAFSLSKDDIKYIKTLHNKNKIANRFINFRTFFKQAEHFNEIKKLNRVNNYVNRIISKADESNEWATPKDFLIKGRGDCEDYAFTKYFSLKKLNIDTSRLYLAVVKVRGSKYYHMVLLYMNNKNIPMTLDNLSWKLMPLNKRKNLEFKYAFNEKASYIFENRNLVKEKGIRRAEVKMFKDMLNRVK